MAESKIKSESYNNLGGINTKVSPYLTGPQEFLDLENFDFTRPGSLTKSPGTTTYISNGYGGVTPSPVNGLFEFTPIAALGGQSLSIMVWPTGGFMFWIAGGIGLGNFLLGGPTSGGSLLPGSPWTYTAFVNRMFAANGHDFFKWDGNPGHYSHKFSLPYGNTTSVGVTAVFTGSGGMSGAYIVGYGYFNDTGYFGPAGPLNGLSIMVNGASYDSILIYGMTFPSGNFDAFDIGNTGGNFGVSGIALYCTLPGLQDQFQATLISMRSTFILDNGSAGPAVLSTVPNPSYIYFTMTPRYLEVFNNSIMMSGFSAFPSTVWFSDIGIPEGIDPTFNFEVRTNDGDRLYGQKSYLGTCIFFKERSFHQLTGSDPTSYSLQEISDQYGCISHRAAVVWNDMLWFLDKKGICQYNGANVQIVSNKVESIFLSMNIDSARDNACAIHNRARNELWFSIPINGSTFNNCTLVYDYVAQGWTTFKGFCPASLFMVKQIFGDNRAFYGDYTGSVLNFDETIQNYNGTAFTCVIGSRFFGDQGRSIQTQFRRLFLDTDPQPSAGASNITFNFMQDYGASVVLTRQMGQNYFQSRIDFGISARSLAFTMYHVSATLPIRVNGWTVEGRLQRMV